MSFFLYADEDENLRKVNIDELYEKQQQRDLKQVAIFNKILNRIHTRIQHTARNKRAEKYIWYAVPAYIFGETLYNQSDCVAYVITKLEENGFYIKFVHPNTLFVSWENWVPNYARQEIKKRTGIVLNERGEVVSRGKNADKDNGDDEDDINGGLLNSGNSGQSNTKKDQKQYKSIDNYKPTGNLVYGKDTLDKLEKRVTFMGGK